MITAYIQLPCLIDAEKGISSRLKVNPMVVVGYLEYGEKQTVIYLQGGQNFILAMNIDEYEAAIQGYFKKVNEFQQKINTKTNLQIKR